MKSQSHGKTNKQNVQQLATTQPKKGRRQRNGWTRLRKREWEVENVILVVEMGQHERVKTTRGRIGKIMPLSDKVWYAVINGDGARASPCRLFLYYFLAALL